MRGKAWPRQSELSAFYGSPHGRNGLSSPSWERENLVILPSPWALETSWSGQAVRGIRIHRLCAESLASVLESIWRAASGDESKIRGWGMHLFGGSYSFRLMRGANALSAHAFGCAVDFDPARNGFGDPKPNFAAVPQVLRAFEEEGWVWGGNWKTRDGMHWQAARV